MTVAAPDDGPAVRSLRPLRIAQIVPPGIPCPPQGYGASELVAGVLTEELVRRGHDVTLFAHPDSPAHARLISFPVVYEIRSADQREIAHTSLALDLAAEFDVIHNHCIVPGASLTRHAATPSLTTLHYWRPILDTFAAEPYVALSRRQAEQLPQLNIVGVAHNGIALDRHPFVAEKSDYLLFLGRLDPKKGPHLAIQAAQRAGMRIVIAAAPPTCDNVEYVERELEPRFGGRVEYVGHVQGAEKMALLGGARCVLMPLQWEEPFGLVAIEALACGTPVVAYRRGAMPEIIADGEAGYLVDDLDGMVEAISRTDSIDPRRCRQAVERDFTDAAMADAYLHLYDLLLGAAAGGDVTASQERAS